MCRHLGGEWDGLGKVGSRDSYGLIMVLLLCLFHSLFVIVLLFL